MIFTGIWSAISFTFSFIWGLMSSAPSKETIVSEDKGEVQSSEPEVKSSEPEVQKPEVLNETEVETDLKSRQRHAEDEIEIKADIVGESKLQEIDEDHGQASEEDKDLYPPRRES